MSRPEFTCSVKVQYLPDRSSDGQQAFAYTVNIVNSGDVTAQLIARQWTVTDADGQAEQIRGLAVVGHQPLLKPGEAFEYTSWTRLATAHGSMRGVFYCMTEDARPFEADVPEFMLAQPQSLH